MEWEGSRRHLETARALACQFADARTHRAQPHRPSSHDCTASAPSGGQGRLRSQISHGCQPVIRTAANGPGLETPRDAGQRIRQPRVPTRAGPGCSGPSSVTRAGRKPGRRSSPPVEPTGRSPNRTSSIATAAISVPNSHSASDDASFDSRHTVVGVDGSILTFENAGPEPAHLGRNGRIARAGVVGAGRSGYRNLQARSSGAGCCRRRRRHRRPAAHGPRTRAL